MPIYDECERSFKAADERKFKSNKKGYSETAIMALVCRHDHILYMLNMTSPGEKRHYVVTLLRQLFGDLPENWRIGLLYDIGCQLHRSNVKWGILKEYEDRILFGISVFHAYGHQWGCQITYHPRKIPGFGLTDGEGCERVWNLIRPLIPILRVTGVSIDISY
jgi:hypothetical protein